MGAFKSKMAPRKGLEHGKRKSPKTCKTKLKSAEVNGGIEQETEEITEQTKSEILTEFQQVVMKKVNETNEKPIQESMENNKNRVFYISNIQSDYYNNRCLFAYSSFEDKLCNQRSRQAGSKDSNVMGKVTTNQQSCQFKRTSKEESTQTEPSTKFCSDCEIRTMQGSKQLLKSEDDSEDNIKSIQEGKTNNRKVSINSLLDESVSSNCSQTELTELKTRVTEELPEPTRFECQSMDNLKLRHANMSLEFLKQTDLAEATDKDLDSNITDDKEQSSSYPDSYLDHSDSSQSMTQSYKDSSSVSYEDSRCSITDSTLAKTRTKSNNQSPACYKGSISTPNVTINYNILTTTEEINNHEFKNVILIAIYILKITDTQNELETETVVKTPVDFEIDFRPRNRKSCERLLSINHSSSHFVQVHQHISNVYERIVLLKQNFLVPFSVCVLIVWLYLRGMGNVPAKPKMSKDSCIIDGRKVVANDDSMTCRSDFESCLSSVNSTANGEIQMKNNLFESNNNCISSGNMKHDYQNKVNDKNVLDSYCGAQGTVNNGSKSYDASNEMGNVKLTIPSKNHAMQLHLKECSDTECQSKCQNGIEYGTCNTITDKAIEHSKLKLSSSVMEVQEEINLVTEEETESESSYSNRHNDNPLAYQGQGISFDIKNDVNTDANYFDIDENAPLQNKAEKEPANDIDGISNDSEINRKETVNNLVCRVGNTDFPQEEIDKVKSKCSVTAGSSTDGKIVEEKKQNVSSKKKNINIGSTERYKNVERKSALPLVFSEVQLSSLSRQSSREKVFYDQHKKVENFGQRQFKQRNWKKKRYEKKMQSHFGSSCSSPVLEDGDNKTAKRKLLWKKTFCSRSHQQHFRANSSKGPVLAGELGGGKFQYQERSSFDSGISTLMSSIRSSILSEMEGIQKIETKKPGRKKRKKLVRNYLRLGILQNELTEITKGIDTDAVTEVDPNIIALPGLQLYFDALRNGGTPSLQERMSFEWLRLMSFSNYTGGGSPVHLARNGFYHSHNNETRCFCCNNSYSGWTYTDNVLEVHSRISPNCPLVTGGIESNGNISIESGTREVQPNQSAVNLGYGTGIAAGTPQPSNGPERQALPGSNGKFALHTNPRPNIGSPTTGTAAASDPSFGFYEAPIRQNPTDFSFPQTSGQETNQGSAPNQTNQSAATTVASLIPTFSFNQATNTPVPTGLNTSQQTDLSTRLQALTVQQSVSGQQPSDEPISGNPVIAPTQPQQIPRQNDGEAQLSISSQHTPQLTDQHISTENQRSETTSSAQRENADLIEVTQLKHPRYSTMAVRMSSFRSWPSYLNQTARQMAYAGFFHPGVADFARCFCCGGGLRNWEADDDPMVEHARWYPRCEYINKLKGTHFVQAVLRRHREHMAERQREQEAIQTTYSTPDPMTTTVAAGLLEMGFTEERAREAILSVRRLRGRSEVSIEEVTAWMLDDESAQNQDLPARDIVGNAPPVSYRSATPPTSNSSSFEAAAAARQNSDGSNSFGSAGDSQGASGGDKKEDKPPTNISSKEDSSDDEKGRSGKENESSDDKAKKGKELDEKKAMPKKGKKSKSRKGKSPGEEATGPLHNDVDTKSLKEENKLLKQMQVCKICMDKYVSVTFLPCGHLVCCEDCAKNMRKCPICRKRIKGQVRTYMS